MVFPPEMKDINNWVLWKAEAVAGRNTKVPYSARYRGRASSTDSESWASFTEAEKRLSSKYSGLGFVIDKDSGIVFIDIDGCLNEGVCDDRASDILGAFGGRTFIEVSQSGRGIHVFAYGTIPRCFKNPENGVEMYSEKRYCAMTGNMFQGSSMIVSHEQAALDYVFGKYRTPEKIRREVHPTLKELSLTDSEIIRRAMRDEHFRRLWDGEYSMYAGSGESGHHIADLVLCTKLAFWTDRDSLRIDALFRCSGLYREKWERSDYRGNTIREACARCDETISEYMIRKRNEEAKKLERYYSSF